MAFGPYATFQTLSPRNPKVQGSFPFFVFHSMTTRLVKIKVNRNVNLRKDYIFLHESSRHTLSHLLKCCTFLIEVTYDKQKSSELHFM